MDQLLPSVLLLGLVGIGAATLSILFGVEVDVGVSPLRFKVSRSKTARDVAAPQPSVLPPAVPPAPSSPDPVGRELEQLREALFAFKLQAEALQGIVLAAPADCDLVLKAWYDSLAVQLALSLRTTQSERYRVGLWESNSDTSAFDALGYASSPSRPRRTKLQRVGSVGGSAFLSKVGEDYRKDRSQWEPLDPNRVPEYESVFGIALGPDDGRWGVMTIDCNLKDGFSEADKQIARHFADLATLGRVLARNHHRGGLAPQAPPQSGGTTGS